MAAAPPLVANCPSIRSDAQKPIQAPAQQLSSAGGLDKFQVNNREHAGLLRVLRVKVWRPVLLVVDGDYNSEESANLGHC